MSSANEFWIGSRKSRFDAYELHSHQPYNKYSDAFLARQRARVGAYDAQIFRDSSRLDASTLVYANPNRRDLSSPYDRVREAFRRWGDCGLLRVLVGRPNVERRYYEALFFCYEEEIGRVSYVVNRVVFQPNLDVVYRYSIEYRVVQGAPILFYTGGETPVAQLPTCSGRVEGIHVSDVCLEQNVYFGYTDSNATESPLRFDLLFDLANPYEA